jgi:hypothetical protein
MADGTLGLRELGPPPQGLAPGAFSSVDPVRLANAVEIRPVAFPQDGSRSLVSPALWRSASPLERSMRQTGDVDLFPHTRRMVPMLVPDVMDVSAQTYPPLRAMNGPSVGVRWKIPGHMP